MQSTQISQRGHVGTLGGVQFLRFFSAFIVMITHATFYVNSRIDASFPIWNDGAQGVSIFFVISGLVMSLSARSLILNNDYKTFLYHRLIRIVPLYWAVNLLKILGLAALPSIIEAAPDLLNIILSFLFIFSRNSNGVVETFYGVGWTLNFEMFFYMVFAIAIFTRFKPLYFVSFVLAICVVSSFIRTENWPAITFLFNTIVINFVWGMLIAEYWHKGQKLNYALATVLALIGFVLVFLPPPVNLYGMQYALLVGGIVFLEPVIKTRIPRFFIFGGNSSYSLYLIHPMVGAVLAALLKKMGVNSVFLAMVSITVICFLVASAIYVFFEKPITDYLKRKYVPKAKIDIHTQTVKS